MDFELTEWLNLIARWIHVFAGIMWIGQTYFFTWLDGRFTELVERSSGDNRIWMVHSGGFYIVEKQRVPALMPSTLHWFRWEAAITWLSGFFLLLLVYYHGGLMVDETMDETVSLVAGIGAVLLAWPAYEILWRSPLGRNARAATVVSFLLITAIAWGLSHVMGGRAMYMHVGAMFGTIMAANVWITIIPAQRRMVAALNAGTQPDLAHAHRAKTCSKHNTFMVVPLIFIMISNHFPTATYGTTYSWLTLAAFVLAGWCAAFLLRRA